MRKTLLSVFITLFALNAFGDTVSSFDSLSLAKPDTFYVNFSAPGTDVGFTDGLAKFPCVYDTSFGFSFWSYGFSYSNMTDSTTQSYLNEYAAITAKGYNQSANYAVAYGADNYLTLTGAAKGHPVKGFYVTNSTYAYLSMKNGDAFAKQFGGANGNDADWFKLQIRGYLNDTIKADTVDFYLADFRPANSATDSIVRHWNWVNLLPLGNVDSLSFHLTSSDTGSFGMNTPAYFCMDNFTTGEPSLSVSNSSMRTATVKVYPNPATEHLYIENGGATINHLYIIDIAGRTVMNEATNQQVTEINTSNLTPGWYILRMESANGVATIRFQKQ